MKWFKIYGERWFMGSTRWELSPEQRSIWVDLLARASINQVPGRIEYFSLEQLSDQFQVNLALLEETLKRCKEVNKIKYYPEKNLILIINWKKYQSEYERQKSYRQQDGGQSRVTKDADNSSKKVTLKGEGEEKRIDVEKKEKEKTEELLSSLYPPPISPLPSNCESTNEGRLTTKKRFLSMLKECKGYPFDEGKDSILFDISVCRYPKIDLLKQLGKRIAWWQLHLDALRANPRAQLYKWFKGEFEYQKQGGPQALGDILKEGDVPDYRDLFKKLIGASNEQSKVNKA